MQAWPEDALLTRSGLGRTTYTSRIVAVAGPEGGGKVTDST